MSAETMLESRAADWEETSERAPVSTTDWNQYGGRGEVKTIKIKVSLTYAQCSRKCNSCKWDVNVFGVKCRLWKTVVVISDFSRVWEKGHNWRLFPLWDSSADSWRMECYRQTEEGCWRWVSVAPRRSLDEIKRKKRENRAAESVKLTL